MSGDHDNPIDATDVDDGERAAMLEEYLRHYQREFDTNPKFMPLDEDGKAPIIRGRCKLDSDDARDLLMDAGNAIKAIAMDGARGFCLYAGREEHGTANVAFVDHDSDEFETPTGEPTLEVLTGSGRGDHETYRNDPDDPVRNARVGDDLGEVRAENWYVVLPGSIHPSGGVYHIHEEREIATISDAELTDEQRPSSEQADDVDSDVDETTTGVPEVSDEASAALGSNAWIGTYLALGGADDRSTKDFAVCRELIEHGVDEEDAYKLLNSSDHTKVGERGVTYWRNTWKKARKEADIAADGGVSATSPPVENGEDGGADTDIDDWETIRALYGEKGQSATDKARYNSMRWCEHEMSFVAGIENEQLRVFDDDRGFYTAHAEHRVRGYLGDDDRLRHAYKRRRGNAVANILIDRHGVAIEKLGGPVDKLCLGNYVLDISDPENPTPDEHTPEYFFTAGYPVNYDPDADCPRWIEFVEDAVEPGDVEKLQEFFGYCLLHDQQPFKKAAFLVGPTDSGKGTALRVLEAILGKENVANETLYNLMNTRWAANSLHGRVANIRNEISPAGVGNVQKFKELVGGEDTIDAEDKHKPKYEFTVTQKFIFATNRFPQVEHADEAFYNRLLFISFPNRVPDSEKDPELAEKLITESAGILNWMLDGLARLIDRGEFANVRDQETKESLVDEFGGPIARFLHACVEITGDDDDLVHKSDLHDLMLAYAQRSGMDERPQQGAFTRAMKTNEGVDDTNARFAAGGDSDKAFTGVRVEPKATAALDVTVRSRTSDGDTTGSQGTL